MNLGYLLRRILFLIMVVWVAATVIFFIPRLSVKNPIRERFAKLAASGGFSPKNLEEIIAAYNKQFGLDNPLPQQYVNYLGQLASGDLGVSIGQYPKTVVELIVEAMPWTIGLLIATTALSFLIGNFVGAIASWPRSPSWVKGLITPLMMLQGFPPYLLGLLLIFYLAFRLKVGMGLELLPMGGGTSQGIVLAMGVRYYLNVLWHLILPASTLILASLGGWALGMRGMGITIQGEDYVNFAEHKGLSPRRIFSTYYVRNALLPQVTGVALVLTNFVGGVVLVEGLYGLPGMGSLLFEAINGADFFVIYGICIALVILTALSMFILDLVNPLLDPRIRYDNK